MTIDEFRSMALTLPGAVESQHMNHPDFRIGGKIFASVGYPDESFAMVKLTPEQQMAYMKRAPKALKPCHGVWGQRGATNVHLPSATKTIVEAALNAARRNIDAKLKKRKAASRYARHSSLPTW